MWLFRRFILRPLLREPLRSAATVAGIALGIAVVIAIRLANTSSLRGFEAALEAMSGRTSVEVVGSGLGIDETRLVDLLWLRQFGDVSPVVEGEAVFLGAEHRGRRDANEGPAAERLHVLGIDILRDQPLRDYRLATSTAADITSSVPSAEEFLALLTDPDAIVLTEAFARRHGLVVGTRVRLGTGDAVRGFVVRGLLSNTGPARVPDGSFALMDIAAAQWALGRLGRIDRIDIRLHDASNIDRIEAEIAARLPDGLTAQRPARRGKQVEQMLAAFHLNLTALSYIALLVGLFLIYNTVSASVVARRHEIGTLRALGVSQSGARWLFLAEAAALALPGCLIGVALGRVLSWGAVHLTSATVSTLYVASAAAPPALGWGDVWIAVGIGVPLALVAAAVPAAEAAGVTPLDAMRGHDQIATRFRLRTRHFTWPIALVALAAWLATLDPIGGLPLAGYGAAVALVFGAASLVPAVLFAAARLGRRVMGRVFGVEGFLANANLGGAIPRLSIAVGALAVSLAMMVAIAVMIGSFRETVVHWVGQTLRADLFIGPSTRQDGVRRSTISADVNRLVTRHRDVEAIDRFRQVSVPYGGTQIYLGSGDFDVLLARGNLLFKAPADGRAAMRGAIGADAVVVSEAFAIRHRKQVGDDVALATPVGEWPFRVAAVYYDYSSDRGLVVMDRATFGRHFGDMLPTGLTIYLRDGADPERVRQDLLAEMAGRFRIYVYTNASLRQEVLRIFDSTFAITYALEVIAILVAILGVSGTLLTLVLERQREMAMLRLVGTDRRQVRRMVVLEALMIGAVSQAVGLVVGVLLSLILIYVINLQSFGWSIQFHLPAAFLGQMSAVMLVATALAGLYPARRAATLPVAREVTEE